MEGLQIQRFWDTGDGLEKADAGNLCYFLDAEKFHDQAQEAIGKNMMLTAERDEAKTVLKAWQDTFGTTQLTHASCRLEAAERKVEMLTAERTELREALEEMVKCHEHDKPECFCAEYRGAKAALKEKL